MGGSYVSYAHSWGLPAAGLFAGGYPLPGRLLRRRQFLSVGPRRQLRFGSLQRANFAQRDLHEWAIAIGPGRVICGWTRSRHALSGWIVREWTMPISPGWNLCRAMRRSAAETLGCLETSKFRDCSAPSGRGIRQMLISSPSACEGEHRHHIGAESRKSAWPR